MTPAERLRRAADALDERAGKATGADHYYWKPGIVRAASAGSGSVFCGAVRIAVTDETLSGGAHNAAYITTLSPDVGKLIAALLRLLAVFDIEGAGPPAPSSLLGHALAVADAILRGAE